MGGDFDRLGIAGMADLDAGHAQIQYLAQHPAVGQHIVLVQAQHRTGDEHHRHAMAAAGAAAIRQAAA